ncbi:hypothetical protein O6H91_16G079300 [Diphasiastrum complanatum]|uniref:Uncharacterized protein n=1 Tax=Diphasiastrum complanatum TaxID=34168 RepID=A0ACC2BEX4_DIPCM|nr:hypothetical protein O6H91_16G079300 [Diphasiastrum complanatum]
MLCYAMAPSEQQASYPHALVLPFPAQGHIIPALQLANKLLSQGIRTTFICAQHRINLIPTTLRFTGRVVALPDKVDLEKEKVDAGVQSLCRSADTVEDMRDSFQQLLNSDQFSDSRIFLISDFLLPWTADIAIKINIPRYVFFPSSATALSVSMYLPSLMAQIHIPLRSSDLHQCSTFIHVPGLPKLLAPSDLPSAFREDCPAESRNTCVKSCLLLREASAIVVNSFSELERPCFRALQNDQRLNSNQTKIYSVGPLLQLDYINCPEFNSEEREHHPVEEPSYTKWLDTQSSASVLYISFGSIAQLSVHQIHEIAHGLEKSTHPFLWVIRQPENCSESTAAYSLLPDGFQIRTKGRGFITFTWAPQLLILSHPSTGGFFTHCGWNSILESICRGIPVLALPQFGEQDLNCRVVVDELQIGVEVEKGEDGVAGREEIERAVRLVMGEKGAELRKKASEWMDAARMASVGSSAANFKSLCNKITSYAYT